MGKLYRKYGVICASLLFASASVSGMASAAVILDQIGTDQSPYVTGIVEGTSSQRLTEPGLENFSSAVVDNFTMTGNGMLSSVSAAMDLTGLSYSNFSGWEVAIYSSISAAASDLTGDVFDEVYAPSGVSIVTPNFSRRAGAIVTIPVQIPLSAGDYYLAVMSVSASMDFGQTYIFTLAGPPGAFPGDQNAYYMSPQRPAGNREEATAFNATYAITGTVPEPISLTFISTGALLTLRRKRNRALPTL